MKELLLITLGAAIIALLALLILIKLHQATQLRRKPKHKPDPRYNYRGGRYEL